MLNGPSEMTLECGVDTWVDPGAQAWDACGPLTRTVDVVNCPW